MSFTLTPDYVYKVSTAYQTLVTQMENGFEQRRPQRSRPIVTWSLNYKTRLQADLNTVLTQFNAGLGQYGTFTFVDPATGNSYNARFKSDTFDYDLIAGQANTSSAIYNFNFEAIQVLT